MLKEKLRELRISCNMTQEQVAERLGISSQTVSKWERGLLSPDVSVLPKIATLFHCTIDSLFDYDIKWSYEHMSSLHNKLETLKEKKDWEGIYDFWIKEIENSPEDFQNYPTVMCWALDKKLYNHKRLVEMRNLADRAQKYCKDQEILNCINWFMIQLCIKSENEFYRELAKDYYKKLPSIKYCREIFAKHCFDGEVYSAELIKTVMFSVDTIDSSLRQMTRKEMSANEKLYYYKKSIGIYEVVFDNKYAGLSDINLLNNYHAVIVLLVTEGQIDEAREYLNKMLCLIEDHLSGRGRINNSKLLNQVDVGFSKDAAQKAKGLMELMKNEEILSVFREEISEVEKRCSCEA